MKPGAGAMSKLVSVNAIAVLTVGSVLLALPAGEATAQNFVASNDKPVPGQPVWQPSFAFPKTAPNPSDAQPWRDVDPIAKPSDYSFAVLNYFMEGQNTTTWRVQDNPVRKWYHMPWMQSGTLGREVIHGLTRERNATPGTLADTQKKCPQTWSIGFFNPPAGHQLWKIWNDGNSAPDFAAASMPEGSVVVKLLFSQADPAEIPYLKGSPSLTANVATPSGGPTSACVPVGETRRAKGTVRLVQVDFAVKETAHPSKTGWFFGTFAYRNEAPGSDPWKKLIPVGISWGNDPELSDALAAGGQKPVEGIVLNKFQFTRDFGRGGRMNGPLDNPASSCMSCHMTAQAPNSASLNPSATDKWDKAKCWFRNLSTQAFGKPPTLTTCGDNAGFQTLDFSLQLQVGWRNWSAAHPQGMATPAAVAKAKMAPAKLMQPMMLNKGMSLPIMR
jgi:hypothetical protein